jgi:6-phosphogluconolactonase
MYKEGVPAEDYALEYEKLLKLLRERMENLTLFYGMGDDGHTASLSGQAVLQERDKWVSAYYLESQSMFRITCSNN